MSPNYHFGPALGRDRPENLIHDWDTGSRRVCFLYLAQMRFSVKAVIVREFDQSPCRLLPENYSEKIETAMILVFYGQDKSSIHRRDEP